MTLNTLLDPERTAFTIALGGAGDGPARVAARRRGVLAGHAFPDGPRRDGGARAADGGAVISPAPTATTDRERRQIDVRLPHAALDPGERTLRVTIGVGLWDPAAEAYLAPQVGSATATSPGGASPTGHACSMSVRASTSLSRM